MLGLVIGSDFYPTVDAVRLHAYCMEQGLDTSWWEEDANTVELRSGYGPNEAFLLLPNSTIELINSAVESDEEGLNTDGTVDTLGANFYDRVIRISRMVKDNPEYGESEDEDAPPQFIEESQDLEGWIFVGSQAIDPKRDSQNSTSIHLARFVDLRGLPEIVTGTYSANINAARSNKDLPADYDRWGYYNNPAYEPNDIQQEGSWEHTIDRMWSNIVRHLPNDKYQEPPVWVTYPYYEDISTDDTGNNRPFNLLYSDSPVFDAFVDFVQRTSHELFPLFDGTYLIYPIHSHTLEDTNWFPQDVDDYDPETDGYRRMKWSMGERLFTRIKWLLDHDHPPGVVLAPHSFTAVFSTPKLENEVRAVMSIALWRGTGDGYLSGNNLIIQPTSLFTQELVNDDSIFTDEFKEDHEYVLTGDYVGKYSTGEADRSRTQYIDCTFYVDPLATSAVETNNIDEVDNGLRSVDSWNPGYPGDQIAYQMAKWNLAAILAGDLGTVTLSGFHEFWPTSRYQTVRFSAGLDGPTTTLIGRYEPYSPFPRKLRTDNLTSDDDFAGIAVVVSTVPGSYVALPTPTGASGDFGSFVQPSVDGEALPLRWNDANELVPNIPTGADPEDHYVPFRIIRDDVLVGAGTLLFIRNNIGHILSSADYLRLLPTDTADPDNDLVCLKQPSGRLVWANADGFVGPTGPPGGGGGGVAAVLPGYAMDVTGGDTVVFDPTEITSFVAAQFQFFGHDDTATAGVQTDPLWYSVSNWNAAQDQMWWHRSGTFEFQRVQDYDDTAGVQQFFHQVGGEWFWETGEDYDGNKKQTLWHDEFGVWKWLEYDKITVRNISTVEIVIEDHKLKLKVHYNNVEVLGKALGTSGTATSEIALQSTSKISSIDSIQLDDAGSSLLSQLNFTVTTGYVLQETPSSGGSEVHDSVPLEECS